MKMLIVFIVRIVNTAVYNMYAFYVSFYMYIFYCMYAYLSTGQIFVQEGTAINIKKLKKAKIKP